MTRSMFAAVASLLIAPAANAENWPQWRGPHGTSISTEKNLALHWSATEGIAWQCPLPGAGASTPAIWRDNIFVTAQDGEKLLLLAIDKATGKVKWTQEVGTGTVVRKAPRRQQKFHQLHNLASPSPVTDGEVVVVHFGNGDLAAYDFGGKQHWLRNLQQEHGEYTIWWGHANSPVLYRNIVISVCMQDSLSDLQDSPAPSYLIAHDKRTGKEVWKTPRMTEAKAEQCDSYTTPLFRETKGGMQMIVMGGNQIDAYDPATGRQGWCLSGIVGGRTITGPTLDGNMAYATQGMRGPLLGIRLGVIERLGFATIAWKHTDGTSDTSCPVVWGNLLYFVSDNGVAQCLDAKTGERQWKERLPAGDYKPSPVAAEDRVYFLTRDGRCTVIAAGTKFEKLAENRINDVTMASIAISNGRIYIRGNKALYCIDGQVTRR